MEIFELPNWVLWRLEDHGGDKLRKVPYQTNGQRASSTNPDTWTTYEHASEHLRGNSYWSGIGFVFASDQPYFGVDLDDCYDSGELSDVAKRVLTKFNTYSEVSPSGKGVKLFCRGNFPLERGRNVKLESGMGLEAYSSGRYFTFTGEQVGDQAEITECSEAAQWLVSEYFVPVGPKTPEQLTPALAGQDVLERAYAYADRVEPAISGQNGHGVTFRLACALVLGFDLGETDALRVLAHYNQRCEPQWSEKELLHKIRSASQQTGPRGYLLSSREYAPDPAVEQVDPEEFEVEVGRFRQGFLARGSFKPEWYCVPGFIGEYTRWVTARNFRKNYTMALAAAIAVQGAMAGRKVRDQYGNRSNVYVVGLSPTGGGKNEALKWAVDLPLRYEYSHLVSREVTSDAALFNRLEATGSHLFVWDECGHFLKNAKSRVGNGPMARVVTELMKLYSSAGSIYQPTSYADKSRDRTFIEPCVSFLGMATQNQFWNALEADNIVDGFASRLIVFEQPEWPDRNSEVLESETPPDSIVEAVKFWKEFLPSDLVSNAANPSPVIVRTDDKADKQFSNYLDELECVTHNRELWTRAYEKARRLSLIYACSANPQEPQITSDAARWGIELSRFTTAQFAERLETELPGESFFSKNKASVRKYLGRCKKKCASRSTLLRSTPLSSKELNEVIETLVESGEVEEFDVAGRTKPTRMYRLRQ